MMTTAGRFCSPAYSSGVSSRIMQWPRSSVVEPAGGRNAGVIAKNPR
ncbi:MAG: hypothetical protein WCV00_11255 [Verrucomicrobiia bacterium]